MSDLRALLKRIVAARNRHEFGVMARIIDEAGAALQAGVSAAPTPTTPCPTCGAPSAKQKIYRCGRCGRASTYCQCAEPIETRRFDRAAVLEAAIEGLTPDGVDRLDLAGSGCEYGHDLDHWRAALREAFGIAKCPE